MVNLKSKHAISICKRSLMVALGIGLLGISLIVTGSYTKALSNSVGAPSNINVTRSNNQKVLNITWTAASNATGYDIVASTDYRQSWTRLATNHSANNLSYTAPDAKAIYFIAVRSLNGNNSSHWVNAGPFAPVGVVEPGAPVLSKEGRAAGSITVSWFKSPSSAVKYHVVYSSDGRRSWSSFNNLNAGSNCTQSQLGQDEDTSKYTCLTLTGLNDTKTYYIAVRTHNDGQWGKWYNSEAIYPAAKVRFSLGQGSCANTEQYALKLTWYARSSNHKYEIKYKVGFNGTWQTHNDATAPVFNQIQPINTKGFSLKWLTLYDILPAADTAYTVDVQMRAVRTAGAQTVYGPWSEASTKAGTAASTQRHFTRCPGTPTNLSATWNSSDDINVSWDAYSDNSVDYDIRHSTDNGVTWTYDSQNIGRTVASTTIDDQDITITIKIQVRYRNWDSNSAGDWAEVIVANKAAPK